MDPVDGPDIRFAASGERDPISNITYSSMAEKRIGSAAAGRSCYSRPFLVSRVGLGVNATGASYLTHGRCSSLSQGWNYGTKAIIGPSGVPEKDWPGVFALGYCSFRKTWGIVRTF